MQAIEVDPKFFEPEYPFEWVGFYDVPDVSKGQVVTLTLEAGMERSILFSIGAQITVLVWLYLRSS